MKIENLNNNNSIQEKENILIKGDKFKKILNNNIKQEDKTKISLEIDKNEKEDKKLKEAVKDFEAFFISQLLGQMRKTVPKTNLLGDGRKEEFFTSLLDEEIGKNISKGRGFGLAEMLYKQLSRK